MPELAIIFGFILIIASIALGVGSSIHKRQLQYRERKDAIEREQAGNSTSDASQKIEQLEQRVRVLERLATDRGQDLASQIEELRGLPDLKMSTNKVEKVQ